MTPEPRDPNAEQFGDFDFDPITSRYKTPDEIIISCAMLDQPIVFVIEDENNGL